MLLGRDLSQMAAKLLPKWEGHPGGKHQPAKGLCMSNSSSGQVSQPGGLFASHGSPASAEVPKKAGRDP